MSVGGWWGVQVSGVVGEPGIANRRSWVQFGAESVQGRETDDRRTADRPPRQQASGAPNHQLMIWDFQQPPTTGTSVKEPTPKEPF